MSSLFNELQADQAVIKSLRRTIRRLTTMSKILKDENGTLYVAHQFEKIDTQQAQELASALQSDLSLIESTLPTPPEQPTTPVQPTVPVNPEQPAAPAQPVDTPAAPTESNPVPAVAPVNQEQNQVPVPPTNPNQQITLQ